MLLMSIPSYYGISYDIHVHGLSIKPYQPAQECKPPITLCVCVSVCVYVRVCTCAFVHPYQPACISDPWAAAEQSSE